jgi:hypothetical protein
MIFIDTGILSYYLSGNLKIGNINKLNLINWLQRYKIMLLILEPLRDNNFINTPSFF